jgi:hypothetical protein
MAAENGIADYAGNELKSDDDEARRRKLFEASGSCIGG